MTHQNFWRVLKSKKAMENVFTDQNFDQEVLGSEKPVVVDFWAPWCGPCQMMGPIVSQLAKDLGNDVKVGKLNVDENPQMAQKFSVMSIPTIIIFKAGAVKEQLVGVQDLDSLKNVLNKIK